MLERMTEQRSEEWYESRKTKFTGSMFPILMTNDRSGKNMGKTALNYIKVVAAEHITRYRHIVGSASMSWGIDNEEEAFNHVNAYSGKVFDPTSFHVYRGPDKRLHNVIGATPDGINDTMVLEIKCPYNHQYHFDRVIDPAEFLKEIKWQVVGEMMCSERNKALCVSYDPRFDGKYRMVQSEVELIESDVDLLTNRILEAKVILDDLLNKFRSK